MKPVAPVIRIFISVRYLLHNLPAIDKPLQTLTAHRARTCVWQALSLSLWIYMTRSGQSSRQRQGGESAMLDRELSDLLQLRRDPDDDDQDDEDNELDDEDREDDEDEE